MYMSESPHGHLTVLAWVKVLFERWRNQVTGATAFWEYFAKTWMPKAEMWVTGNRNIPHAGQDTNAAIESYHNNMKVVSGQTHKTAGGLADS